MLPGHIFPEIEIGWLRKGESVGEEGEESSVKGGVAEHEENIDCGSGDSIDEIVGVGECGITIAV